MTHVGYVVLRDGKTFQKSKKYRPQTSERPCKEGHGACCTRPLKRDLSAITTLAVSTAGLRPIQYH